MDNNLQGVFSTRSPSRPNSIGLSIVEIENISENIITIKKADMLDQSPLLDIKPYITQIDSIENAKIGWLQNNIDKHKITRDDGRFSELK